MALNDVFILIASLSLFIIVVGSLYRYISIEIALRKWNKENEI